MGVYATHLAELAHACGAVEIDSIATGGSATTLIDTAMLGGYADDTFNDCRLYIYQGTGLGQERRITDHTGSSSTLTIPSGATIDSTSRYLILKKGWTMADLRTAFLMAMRRRRRMYMLPKVDESITLAISAGVIDYRYDVPAGFAAIQSIVREMTASGSDFHKPLADDYWYINRAATREIVFQKVANDNDPFIVDGLKIRIIGQQYETEPTADTSSLTIPTGALLLLAASLALMTARSRDIQNTQGFGQTSQALYQEWLVARGDDETLINPGSKLVNE